MIWIERFFCVACCHNTHSVQFLLHSFFWQALNERYTKSMYPFGFAANETYSLRQPRKVCLVYNNMRLHANWMISFHTVVGLAGRRGFAVCTHAHWVYSAPNVADTFIFIFCFGICRRHWITAPPSEMVQCDRIRAHRCLRSCQPTTRLFVIGFVRIIGWWTCSRIPHGTSVSLFMGFLCSIERCANDWIGLAIICMRQRLTLLILMMLTNMMFKK